MALPEQPKPSIDQILKLYDSLTPEEQAKLHQAFIDDQEGICIALE